MIASCDGEFVLWKLICTSDACCCLGVARGWDLNILLLFYGLVVASHEILAAVHIRVVLGHIFGSQLKGQLTILLDLVFMLRDFAFRSFIDTLRETPISLDLFFLLIYLAGQLLVSKSFVILASVCCSSQRQRSETVEVAHGGCRVVYERFQK